MRSARTGSRQGQAAKRGSSRGRATRQRRTAAAHGRGTCRPPAARPSGRRHSRSRPLRPRPPRGARMRVSAPLPRLPRVSGCARALPPLRARGFLSTLQLGRPSARSVRPQWGGGSAATSLAPPPGLAAHWLLRGNSLHAPRPLPTARPQRLGAGELGGDESDRCVWILGAANFFWRGRFAPPDHSLSVRASASNFFAKV